MIRSLISLLTVSCVLAGAAECEGFGCAAQVNSLLQSIAPASAVLSNSVEGEEPQDDEDILAEAARSDSLIQADEEDVADAMEDLGDAAPLVDWICSRPKFKKDAAECKQALMKIRAGIIKHAKENEGKIIAHFCKNPKHDDPANCEKKVTGAVDFLKKLAKDAKASILQVSEEEQEDEEEEEDAEDGANTTKAWSPYENKRHFCVRWYWGNHITKVKKCYMKTVPHGVESQCYKHYTEGNGYVNQCQPCTKLYDKELCDRVGVVCTPGMVPHGPGKKRAVTFRCADECNLKRCHGGVNSAQSNAVTACESDTAYC